MGDVMCLSASKRSVANGEGWKISLVVGVPRNWPKKTMHTMFDNTRLIRATQSAVDVSLDAFEFINVRIRQAVLVAVDQGCMQSARSLCK